MRLADFDARNRDFDQAHGQARRVIKDIEQEYGQLSNEEKQLIVNMHLNSEGNLDALNNHTNQLAELYNDKINQSWLSRKINKVGSKILTIAMSIGSSVALRFALKGLAIGGVPIAGTITGLVVGGAFGAWRGYAGEKNRQYGISGLMAEYEDLKNDPTNPTNRQDAITFLYKAIESKQVRGNAAEVIKLINFYKQELGKNCHPEDIEGILDELVRGQFDQDDPQLARWEQYQEAARAACVKSMINGGLKGMAFGGLIGAASDLVSWATQYWRYHDAIREYRNDHFGYEHEMHPGYDTSVGPVSADPVFTHNAQDLGLEPTAYGKTLAGEMAKRIGFGELHVPDAYLDMMKEQGVSRAEAIKQFVDSFNYAQPQPGTGWMAGQSVSFNMDGVQTLMNNVVSGGQLDINDGTIIGGHVDYGQFSSALKNAGNFLYHQFPTSDNAQLFSTTDNILMQRAHDWALGLNGNAINHVAEPAWQTAIQGAVAGAVMGQKANKIGKEAENPQAKEDKEEKDEILANQDTADDRTPGEIAREQAATAGETDAAPSPNEPPPNEPPPNVEIEQPPTPIDWTELFYGNYQEFAAKANRIMTAPQVHDWEEMPKEIKTQFTSLLKFIFDYNEQGKRFQIRFADRYTGGDLEYRIASDPDADMPVLKLKTAGGEDEIIDMTNKGASLKLRLYEREADDTAKPHTFTLDDLKDYKDEYDFEMIQRFLAFDRREKQDAKIIIERKPGQKLHPSEDTGQTIEVIGSEPAQKRVIALLPDGRKIPIKDALSKIQEFKIYHWDEGGIDKDYTTRVV